MNDQELSDLLQEAKAQTPKPSQQLATRTMAAWRAGFARPSWLVRHWRVAAAAGAVLIAIGLLGTRSSVGSPLPPEYNRRDVIASGHVHVRDGWIMDYSTVLRPVHGVQPASVFTGTDVQESENNTVVFHRYFGNTVTKVYYGYDIVLQSAGTLGEVAFRPLSEVPEKMPEKLREAGSRLLEVRELPTKKFSAGQNIAVTLLNDPATGQQVIDYVHVDTNLFDMVHHILNNMVRAVHSHFEHH